MNLLEFINKTESTKNIGQVECMSIEEATSTLVSLMSSMGMANPTTPTNSSLKGVTITKKGRNIVITLSMFNPPITFVWTGLMPAKSLPDIIAKIINEKKKIGSINNITLSDGSKYVQVGVTR
ncbi:MAG: hypothetical protein ABI721_02955 [Candidatus Dojkabacteria bacterium]